MLVTVHASPAPTVRRVVLVLLALLLGLPAPAAAAPAWTVRAAPAAGGGTASGASDRPHLSQDGRWVCFDSSARDLVADPSFAGRDVYLRDLQEGTTTLVSRAPDGRPANGFSTLCSISGDGRHVAYTSAATNLVGDGHPARGVYVFDRLRGETERVSVDDAGRAAAGASERPSISADGRFVAFNSAADHLVAGDDNGTDDVFLRDRVAGTTHLVSRAPDGTPAAGYSYRPELSPDGGHVAFVSEARDLVPGVDRNQQRDVYLFTRATGVVELVSVAQDGEAAMLASARPHVSAGGRLVVFQTLSPDIVSGDTNGEVDVFVRDRDARVTTRVSVTPDGRQLRDESNRGVVTGDGRFVAYTSGADGLTDDDAGCCVDVFLRELATGTTRRVSVDRWGGDPNARSYRPELSADARRVAFVSFATDLVPDDTTDGQEVFVVDVDALPGTTVVDRVAPTVTVTAPARGEAVSAGTVTLRGTATDDVAPMAVSVALRDESTRRWLGRDGRFGPFERLDAVLEVTTDSSSAGWSLDVDLPPGEYGFNVDATDAAGRRSPRPWSVFTVHGSPSPDPDGPPAPTDANPPEVTVTTPRRGERLTGRVTLAGAARDDVEVAGVTVAVRRASDRRWLAADGTFGGFRRIAAELDAAGTWSFEVDLPAGDFGLSVQARDRAGRTSAKNWTPFSVRRGDAGDPAPPPTDGAAPTVVMTQPARQQRLAGPSVELRGTAADDRGVASVSVAVRNAAGRWLRPDGTFGAFTRVPAEIVVDGTSATWRLAVDLPAGRYGGNVEAVDAVGRRSSRPWTSFVVTD